MEGSDKSTTPKRIDEIEVGLVKMWKHLKAKPTVIVFDLDYTLWPFYIDSTVTPPLTKKVTKNTIEIIDGDGYSYKPFKDVTKILRILKEKCLGENGHLAIASRSSTKDLAMEAIEMYGWTQYISSFQIYPRIKNEHMNKIKSELNFESFNEVLFFDDDIRNYNPTADLGVLPFLVNQVDGLNYDAVLLGLEQYSKKFKRS